ncbi:MAG: hypothetical protein GX493_03385, partial [Firmicutes bacterium]|nr:hypothetical protein [Bacillota bacterium]
GKLVSFHGQLGKGPAEAQGSLFRSMLVGIGLVEATPIIALVIAFILLFANPLV